MNAVLTDEGEISLPAWRTLTELGLLLRQGIDPIGDISVQQQLHAGAMNSFRSRSAAKARQARISSRVNSEKSLRISSSLMPPARYSRISCTVMRMPRMHGLPLRLPGSMVMIFE